MTCPPRSASTTWTPREPSASASRSTSLAGAAPSDRVDVRVLEEEQCVRDLTGDALRMQLALERERFVVGDDAETLDV